MSLVPWLGQAVSQRLLQTRPAPRLVHRTRGPDGLAALLTRSADTRGLGDGQVNCLCLLRRGLSQDGKALRERAPAFNWLDLRNEDLVRVQRLWVPTRFMKKASYPCYRELGTSEAAAVRERNAELAWLLVGRLADGGLPVHAVPAANFDYWQDEGLKGVSPDLGAPFLVLNREHVMTDAAARNYAGHYRRVLDEGFRFETAAKAVFGPRTKAAVVGAGLVEPDRVVVTGAPRADYLRDVHWPPDRADTVLVMSFALPTDQAVGEFEQSFRVVPQVAADAPALPSDDQRQDREEIVQGRNFELPDGGGFWAAARFVEGHARIAV